MLRTEQLRAFLLEYLKAAAHRRQQLQFSYCLSGVAGIAKARCPELIAGDELREEDGARLKHVIWDLILERILIPSTGHPQSASDGWPFLSVTEHGKKVIAEQRPVPYDPDGYLARLRTATGGLHPTVVEYLAEAVATFRTGNNLASAVMLGAASEMLFIELCEATAESFASRGDESAFRCKTGRKSKMAERVKAVMDWLTRCKSQLPTEWQSVERHRLVEKIADLIRNRRNESGHPQDPPMKPSHEEMYALLMLFPDYCEKLYDLKKWLQERKGAIS